MNLLKKFYLRKLRKTNYPEWLRRNGFEVGSNCRISNFESIIDRTDVNLIKIGNNVVIASGVTILTHDASYLVICYKNGRLFGGGAPVAIGNNVFIGMHSTILKGTEIGDNVIIGAGSLVKGKIESDSVYAGVPAKKICSLAEYEVKVGERQIHEAYSILKEYYEKYNDIPTEKVFYHYNYVWLWKDISKDIIYLKKHVNINNPLFKVKMASFKPPFKNYNDFVKSFLSEYKIKIGK